MDRTSGILMVVGSFVFFVGATIGVPRVFGTSSPEARLRLLEEHLRAWRAAQPLYALGPVVAAVGVTLDSRAGLPMLVGALAWCRSCYLRSRDHVAFARGELPGWPYYTYVWATLAGLALLGWDVHGSDQPGWLWWFVWVCTALLVGLLVATRDLPPFLFYIVLTVAGIVLIV